MFIVRNCVKNILEPLLNIIEDKIISIGMLPFPSFCAVLQCTLGSLGGKQTFSILENILKYSNIQLLEGIRFQNIHRFQRGVLYSAGRHEINVRGEGNCFHLSCHRGYMAFMVINIAIQTKLTLNNVYSCM